MGAAMKPPKTLSHLEPKRRCQTHGHDQGLKVRETKLSVLLESDEFMRLAWLWQCCDPGI